MATLLVTVLVLDAETALATTAVPVLSGSVITRLVLVAGATMSNVAVPVGEPPRDTLLIELSFQRKMMTWFMVLPQRKTATKTPDTSSNAPLPRITRTTADPVFCEVLNVIGALPVELLFVAATA